MLCDLPAHLTKPDPSTSIAASLPQDGAMPFVLQPIVATHDSSVYAYEVLYRGIRPVDWREVDRRLMEFLSAEAIDLTRLSVNITNQSLVDLPASLLIAAARRNQLIFELSEEAVSPEMAQQVAVRVNFLSRKGLNFALDDFGAGQDGLSRLLMLDSYPIVKIDGSLLQSALEGRSACHTLQQVIACLRRLGIIMLAERIETPRLLAFAQWLGVDLLQGFHVDTLVPHPRALIIPAKFAGAPGCLPR